MADEAMVEQFSFDQYRAVLILDTHNGHPQLIRDTIASVIYGFLYFFITLILFIYFFSWREVCTKFKLSLVSWYFLQTKKRIDLIYLYACN